MVIDLMPYTVLAFGASDIGLVRQNNEDVWEEVPGLRLYVLADGMGGHRAGEIAARKAVDTLCRLIKKGLSAQKEKIRVTDARAIVMQSIKQANEMIYQLGHSSDDLKGMGTTLCCLLFLENDVVYGHVGDSRIYGVIKKKLHRMTKDHSLLSDLIDLGQISESQATDFMYKNILTRAVGTEPNVEPSVHVCGITDGDIYFMCSDGLTDLLSDAEIESIINHTDTIQDAVNELVESAKARGGYDNITILMMQIQEVHEKANLFRQQCDDANRSPGS